MILRGARIPGAPGLVDLRLEGGRIAELAPHLAGDGIDLDGRWVVPGLWDAHVHAGQAALASRRLDVSRADSAAEAVALVRARLASAEPEPGEILVGNGFRDGLWPDPPAEGMLDLGDVPVALVSGDLHTVWSNRAALRRLERPDRLWFAREQDAFDLESDLASVPPQVLDRWVLEVAAAAAKRGVVGIRDIEADDAPAAWARRVDAGFAGLRVVAALYPETLDRYPGRRTGDAVDGAGLVRLGNLKLFGDGSLNTRTAWCGDAYPDGGHGVPTYADDDLLAAARHGVDAGMAPTIHAIGDAAVTQALDVFERLGTPGRIEHAQLVRASDLPRFAAFGVVASVQPEQAMDDRDVADHYWAGRTGRAFAYRSLLDAGATLEFGSDAPVAPLDPWITIAAAVTRSRDGRAPWHPEQRVTAAEALAASTGGVREVAVGGPADLAVLDADPLAPGTDLRGMPVAATLAAGEWSYLTV